MSTRSNIVIRNQRSWTDHDGEEVEEDERVTLYKHHDGYPEGTVPLLRRFYQWNGGRNSDVEYSAANLVYYYKRWNERNDRFNNYGDSYPLENQSIMNDEDGNLSKEKTRKAFEVPPNKTGMGVCTEDHIHGDCEYLWVIEGEVLKMYDLGIGHEMDVEDLIDEEPDEVYDLTENPTE